MNGFLHTYDLKEFFCKEIKECKIEDCKVKCPYNGEDFIRAVNDNGYTLSKIRCIFVGDALNKTADEYILQLVKKNVSLVRGC